MAKDPYVYPGSGVLRNNLKIHDHHELSRAEADIVRASLAILSGRPLRGDYDLAHWQAFHSRIFAGSIRGLESYGPSRSQSPTLSTLALSTSRGTHKASSLSLLARTT